MNIGTPVRYVDPVTLDHFPALIQSIHTPTDVDEHVGLTVFGGIERPAFFVPDAPHDAQPYPLVGSWHTQAEFDSNTQHLAATPANPAAQPGLPGLVVDGVIPEAGQ